MVASIPHHVGIIMDGNRRWARSRGFPTLEGHRRGYGQMKKVVRWCADRGVRVLTVFAFSTENWKRSEEEVTYLMRLIRHALTHDLREFHREKIRLRVIGQVRGLSRILQQAIRRAERLTQNNRRLVLNIAVNYGGRQEILETVKKVIRRKLPPKDLTEERFARLLSTGRYPDPDLIIRTSGEQRLSGFLTWQSAYSELYFSKKHWPAYTERDLGEALDWYASRQRRFGK